MHFLQIGDISQVVKIPASFLKSLRVQILYVGDISQVAICVCAVLAEIAARIR